MIDNISKKQYSLNTVYLFIYFYLQIRHAGNKNHKFYLPPTIQMKLETKQITKILEKPGESTKFKMIKHR